jgi:thiamine-phosphate pyrophosphorylase
MPRLRRPRPGCPSCHDDRLAVGADKLASEPLNVGERRRAWLERARLYFVCDARPGGREAEEVLRAALQSGVDVVQLREKSEEERDLVEAARVFRRLCDAYDALFIVNDDPDVAIACAADGVHIGQDDASADEVRRVIGDDGLIGLSTHSREQVEAAAGVDYISVGPVFATPTKPEYEPVGTELVSWASEHAGKPFFAIGGIDPGNVGDVLDAGASRIAVVRAIAEAPDPGEAARELRSQVAARDEAGAPS